MRVRPLFEVTGASGNAVAPGLIAYEMLWRRSGIALVMVLNVLFAYKVLTFLSAEQYRNLLSSAGMLATFFP